MKNSGEVLVGIDDTDEARSEDKYEDVVGFKYETFAPYSIFQMDKLYHDVDLAPLNNNNVVGLHWFNGHKFAKEYVNQNKFGDNSSMTEILKLCGYNA